MASYNFFSVYMYLTSRNRRVIHIYNGKDVMKVYYDRSGSTHAKNGILAYTKEHI